MAFPHQLQFHDYSAPLRPPVKIVFPDSLLELGELSHMVLAGIEWQSVDVFAHANGNERGCRAG